MTAKISRYENYKLTVSNGQLTITVNINETEVDVRESGSGKTLVLATTGGAVNVPGTPLKLNMTLYRKP